MVLRTLRGDRLRMNLFPELRDRWHVQQNENISYLDIPANALVIDEIYSYDLAVAVAEPDESLAQRRIVPHIEETDYEGRSRNSTPTGWPSGWTRMENRVYFAPTPGTGWGSWLLWKGLKKPTPLVTDVDVPILRDIWNESLQDAAAYLLFKDLGWEEDSIFALKALDTSITNTIDVIGMGRTRQPRRVRFKGMPRG